VKTPRLSIPEIFFSYLWLNYSNVCFLFKLKFLFLNVYLELKKYQARLSNVLRHEKSVENFIYILDGNLPISTGKKRKLRSLINFGRTFNDINDEKCIEFIDQIVNEQIIMILSRTSMKNLDTSIRNASQLRFIYIVDDTKDSSNDFEKNRGIYTNISSVCAELEKDIKLLTYDLTTILSVPADDTSDSTFAYIQVLKDILLETDEKTDLKKEMLDFCRQEYAENEVQLRFIDEFEQNFQADEAVKWYTRQETFLFKMLTRALRIPDPDILFKLRFFIQHLHHQLKSNLSKTLMTVYRAQHISNDDFDTILKNQGGFLAFNQFLSTNKTKIIPKKAKNDLFFNNSEVKFVLFQMEIGTTIPRTSIETIPEEILITMATVFRISHVEQIDKEIPIIKLTSNDEVFKAAQEVTKSVREAARGPFPLLRMAKLMKQMEYIQYTEHFCLILMNDPMAVNNEIANLTVGGLFHTLCSFYYEQEQYDRALEQLEKSLQVYLRVLPPDDIKLTPTYNNMGSIYHKQGLDEQALQFHKKAYDTQVKSSNLDPDSVAAYASNIASVLIKQGKYEEAIPYLQRDLQIRQRLHPNDDDTNLAVKYHNLAGAQFRVHKYSDALENYRKCLEIELRVHSANHPTVAVSYYNMATTLEGLGQLEEAIETIQKARERLLLTRDENDEEVQMHQEYEKRLQQKLWVKSLFNTS
jgi:tetratricopeptide (TPR) repeat protein